MSLHEQNPQHTVLLHNKQWADIRVGYLLFAERTLNGTQNSVFDSKIGYSGMHTGLSMRPESGS